MFSKKKDSSANKKMRGYKFFPEVIEALRKLSIKYDQPETTIIEALLDMLFELPDSKQKEIIAKYLTKNL